jgi:hypothetical protein
MKAGEMKNCEACGKQMVGALNPNTGAVSPIEVEPDERGNVVLHRRQIDGVMTVCAWTLGKLDIIEKAKKAGVELRLNHFAYCPEKARFGRQAG